MSSFAALSMFETIYRAVPDGLHLVLFRLNPARSVSYTDLDSAAKAAANQPDVWVHVGLSGRAFQGGDRPKALEIDAICGMWADVDYADPVHKKPGLPPDQDAARAVIAAMGLPPGLVIHSGHGLQAWWPFGEVWAFEDAAEQRRARIMARAWAITLRERAKQLGYTVDMVSDISRVLRVAGTLNVKAEPVPVTILEQGAATISEDDVLAVLLDGAWEQAERDIDQRRTSGDEIVYGDLTLDPKADPPFDKFVALLEAEPKFRQSWNHQRKDLDGSPSAYDFSLAQWAVRAGWARQEIASLMIACRRKHGEDLKLRQDYFQLTIDKAMAGHEAQEAMFEAIAAASEAPTTDDRSDAERSDLLKKLSDGIGIEITRFTRSRSEPPVFGIETPKGSGSLGGISHVISNRKFREKIAELTNVIPRAFKTEPWDAIAQRLLELAEVEELGVETTVAGRAETLISLYLGVQAPQVRAEMDDRVKRLLPISLSPYIAEDGRTRIFSTGFKVWLSEVHHEVMTAQEIGTMLRAIGAEPDKENFTVEGRRTQRALWALPKRGDE